MSVELDEPIKRWTARRRSDVSFKTIQGSSIVVSRTEKFDLSPLAIEPGLTESKAGWKMP